MVVVLMFGNETNILCLVKRSALEHKEYYTNGCFLIARMIGLCRNTYITRMAEWLRRWT